MPPQEVGGEAGDQSPGCSTGSSTVSKPHPAIRGTSRASEVSVDGESQTQVLTPIAGIYSPPQFLG